MAKNEIALPQNIILENRKRLRISGVKDIDNFTETKVVLNTVMGEIEIKGEELHIITLETEAGDFSMTGHVNSITYNDFASGSNIFRRIFR